MREKGKYIGNEKEYLSDEALAQLIAETEEQSLMHPPADFQEQIVYTIRRRRKHRKDAFVERFLQYFTKYR